MEGQLFTMLVTLPLWATVTSIVVLVLTAVFFVAEADAASLVMGTPSQRSRRRGHPRAGGLWIRS